MGARQSLVRSPAAVPTKIKSSGLLYRSLQIAIYSKLKMMFVSNYVLLSLSLVLNNFDAVFAGTDGNLRAAADLKNRRRIEDQACLSVVDTICGNKDWTSFCTMLKDAEANNVTFANEMENGDKNFTVFVPNDVAFGDFVTNLIDIDGVNDVDKVALLSLTTKQQDRIVQFHIYENIVLSYDELVCSETLTSVSGDESRTKCEYLRNGGGPGGFTKTLAVKYQNGNGNTKHDGLPQPKIETQDMIACNGIIHGIDHIMFPVSLGKSKTTKSPAKSPTKDPTPSPTKSPVKGPTTAPTPDEGGKKCDPNIAGQCFTNGKYTGSDCKNVRIGGTPEYRCVAPAPTAAPTPEEIVSCMDPAKHNPTTTPQCINVGSGGYTCKNVRLGGEALYQCVPPGDNDDDDDDDDYNDYDDYDEFGGSVGGGGGGTPLLGGTFDQSNDEQDENAAINNANVVGLGVDSAAASDRAVARLTLSSLVVAAIAAIM